jgi:hypothetical protein
MLGEEILKSGVFQSLTNWLASIFKAVNFLDIHLSNFKASKPRVSRYELLDLYVRLCQVHLQQQDVEMVFCC